MQRRIKFGFEIICSILCGWLLVPTMRLYPVWPILDKANMMKICGSLEL